MAAQMFSPRHILFPQTRHTMKLSRKNKILLGTGIVFLILIITNPSVSAFKTFRGRASYEGLRRPVNLFVYSVYKDHSTEFIGLFGNFFRISPTIYSQTATNNDPFAKYGGHEMTQSEIDSVRQAKLDTSIKQ